MAAGRVTLLPSLSWRLLFLQGLSVRWVPVGAGQHDLRMTLAVFSLTVMFIHKGQIGFGKDTNSQR